MRQSTASLKHPFGDSSLLYDGESPLCRHLDGEVEGNLLETKAPRHSRRSAHKRTSAFVVIERTRTPKWSSLGARLLAQARRTISVCFGCACLHEAHKKPMCSRRWEASEAHAGSGTLEILPAFLFVPATVESNLVLPVVVKLG